MRSALKYPGDETFPQLIVNYVKINAPAANVTKPVRAVAARHDIERVDRSGIAVGGSVSAIYECHLAE
jgi:hypothetical protein